MALEKYYEGEPLRIGDETQLLMDDFIVEDRWRLTRTLHHPDKYLRNPILLRDKPWEGDLACRPWVIRDEGYGRYRMWYQCFSTSSAFRGGGPPYFVGYAESDDGITWEKPLLDGFAFAGFPRTNIVYAGTHGDSASGVQVFVDPEDPDPQRRYKMIVREARPRGDRINRGVSLACSPDGFRWQLSGEAHILDYHSDCHNHVVFDPVNRRWLLYCRPIYMYATGRSSWDPPGGGPGTRHTKRRVAVMTSRDFVHWSYPRTVMYPDERDTPDYDACTVFRYGGQFLMFYCAMDGDRGGTNEMRIASSRGGLVWERFHAREPFLGRGREGDWDAGQVSSSCPPVRQGENLLIYYTGTQRGQSDGSGGMGGIGLAFTKADRFVEQRAGDEPGYLLTREFILEGNRLRLNTGLRWATYRAIQMRVEVVRRPELGRHHEFSHAPACEGFSFADCDLIRADRTDLPVTWRGSPDLSALSGRPVYLRFEMQNMGLYAFRITRE